MPTNNDEDLKVIRNASNHMGSSVQESPTEQRALLNNVHVVIQKAKYNIEKKTQSINTVEYLSSAHGLECGGGR